MQDKLFVFGFSELYHRCFDFFQSQRMGKVIR